MSPSFASEAVSDAVAESLLVDVRGESEWRGGHLPGAVLLPLPELPERLEEIPRERPGG